MEKEKGGHLPFLSTDICKGPDGSLDHNLYQKPSHTNLCLNPGSQHYTYIKEAVLAHFVRKARAVCDKENHHGELEFLKTTFKEHVNNLRQIRALTRWSEPPSLNICQPQSPSNHISR